MLASWRGGGGRGRKTKSAPTANIFPKSTNRRHKMANGQRQHAPTRANTPPSRAQWERYGLIGGKGAR